MLLGDETRDSFLESKIGLLLPQSNSYASLCCWELGQHGGYWETVIVVTVLITLRLYIRWWKDRCHTFDDVYTKSWGRPSSHHSHSHCSRLT